MKKVSTAERLRYLMEKHDLSQSDIVKRCQPVCAFLEIGINKSDISQYVSGKTEPNSAKLVALGMALGVTEAWLMGYDVPSDRYQKQGIEQGEREFEFFYKYSQLGDYDKKVVLDLIDIMLSRKGNGAD